MTVARRMVAALAVVLMASVSAMAQQQAPSSSLPALQQVPGKSLGFLYVKNLQELSGKEAAWATKLGIPDRSGATSDLLGFISQKAKVSQGLNKQGDMAIAVVNTGQGFNAPQPPILMLIPVSDYNAFLGNFTNVKTDAGVSTVTVADGTPAYVAQWGAYAALTPTADVLKVAPGGLTVSPASEKELETADVSVLLNMPTVRAIVVPLMVVGHQQIQRQIEQVVRQTPYGKYSAVIRVAFNQIYGFAQKLVSECDDVALGVKISDNGIGASFVADFKPDGHYGQMLAQTKNSDQSLLAGLPEDKYILLSGMVSDPKADAQFIGELVDPVLAEAQNMGPDGKTVTDYIQSFKDIMASTTAATMTGIIAPTGELGTSPLIQFVKIANGDAKTMFAAAQKLLQMQSSTFKGMGGAGNPMPMQLNYTAAAKTLDGVQFDQYHIGFDMGAAQNPQMAQVGQILAFVYGQDGLNLYSGVVNDNTYLQVGGISDEKISAAIAAAKSDADVLGKQQGIQNTAAQLPKERVSVMYVPLDVLVNTGFGYVAKFGLDMGVTVPPTDPIGMTFGTDGAAVRGDLFIPGGLLTAGSDVAKKLTGMRGGPRPGPGGAAPAGGAPGGGGL